jgi:GNAT superfamily N-acetyltransferase/2-polyprenyl-3-methyl-5-hydroxy-6-metoxy-1,4-benzoquinol methylase
MNWKTEFCCNRATEGEIANHLSLCDANFVPPLSSRVEISEYAHKISVNATRFEAWVEGSLVGLVAVYCNDASHRFAYITSVSVLPGSQGSRIATFLTEQCIRYLRELGFECAELEVHKDNGKAIQLYERLGFIAGKSSGCNLVMGLNMRRQLLMTNQRDYNVELKDTANHRYAYTFDFDIMHPYMIRSFEPFFNDGSLLELGSHRGHFTKRFLSRFDDVTCVEASDVAIEEAKRTLGDKVHFFHSTFETAILPRRYDNVVLTHVLEHLDEPVQVLKRVNDEWLTARGRLFLVCPNANAPSRQIAVKMGLISHNAAVTPAESEHGHRRTYSLDTLERDATASGLKVMHRSGIFFKALANFQLDRLLKTDIISKEYLEGCYKLGQLYPDLCSSIFLMCEKGEHAQGDRI